LKIVVNTHWLTSKSGLAVSHCVNDEQPVDRSRFSRSPFHGIDL
jgi:hypothetical protein